MPLKQFAPRVYSWVDFTPTVDTAIYAQNDILWIPKIVTSATWKIDQPMKLEQIVYTDVDDDTALDVVLYFLDSSTSTLGGAVNATFGPSDAEAITVCAKYTVTAASFVDIGGAKQSITQPGIWIKPVTGTRDVYCGATYTTAATPTYATAADLKLRFCFSS
jgi:hypothetical protein